MNPETEFRPGLEKLADHYKDILTLLGEDPEREGLVKTPMRVAKAMQTLTRGYTQDPKKVLTDALFEEKYNQMVIVKDIDFFSMCEHHMLPFFGKAHVAYIPNGYITGLSKIARVVDIFSHRLQVQERLTEQIEQCIREARGTPPVYADARRGKAKLHDYDKCLQRCLRVGKNQNGVPQPAESEITRHALLILYTVGASSSRSVHLIIYIGLRHGRTRPTVGHHLITL